MVSKASEDLPEPDRPVITTSLSRGISRSMFLRLCCRAPLNTILPAMSLTDSGTVKSTPKAQERFVLSALARATPSRHERALNLAEFKSLAALSLLRFFETALQAYLIAAFMLDELAFPLPAISKAVP